VLQKSVISTTILSNTKITENIQSAKPQSAIVHMGTYIPHFLYFNKITENIQLYIKEQYLIYAAYSQSKDKDFMTIVHSSMFFLLTWKNVSGTIV
jgi:hypothetical protein